MQSVPTISVVMPVYNAEQYVAQAVQSILSQTFTDIEFLIVDDGSTDSSLRILERFAANDARVRLISRPNTGYVIALNEMLALAQGEFIARMDADDISLPTRFAQQVKLLKTHNEHVALGTQAELIDKHGWPIMVLPVPLEHKQIDDSHFHLSVAAILHPSAMIRSETLRRVGGYRAEYMPAEDVDLWLRLAELGQVKNLDQVLIQYRVHLASIGHKQRQTQVESAWRAATDAAMRRGVDSKLVKPTTTMSPSVENTYAKWAWWALHAGNLRTALFYAGLALASDPLNSGRWKQFIVTIADPIRMRAKVRLPVESTDQT